MVSEAERVARQQAKYDRHNVGRSSAFAKMDVVPEWVRNDPNLIVAWALDRSITTAETATRRHRRLDGSPRLARSVRLATALLTPVAARSSIGIPRPRR
ncbi:Importin subunit beta-1 [Hordeum vulgare]|nr:Importin subunit beta-1 [Hordeum vulgare]